MTRKLDADDEPLPGFMLGSYTIGFEPQFDRAGKPVEPVSTMRQIGFIPAGYKAPQSPAKKRRKSGAPT